MAGRPLARPGAGRGLRARLLLLVAALLVPALLASLLLLWRGWAAQRRDETAVLRTTVQALSTVVSTTFDEAGLLLHTLADATTSAADLPMLARAARASGALGGWIVVTQGGREVVDTALPPGAVLPPWPWRALPPPPGTPGVRILPLLRQPRTGEWMGAAMLKLRWPGGDFAVSLELPATRFQSLIREQRLPAGWSAGIEDQAGVVVARRVDPVGGVGRPGRAALLRHAAAANEGLFPTLSPEGVPVLKAFTHTASGHWTIFASLPRPLLATTDGASLVALGAIGAALLLAGLAAAVATAAGIARPIEALARSAGHLDRAAPLPGIPSGLREADHAMAAMAVAHATLNARRQSLAELADTLAARVAQRTAALAVANEALSLERARLGMVLETLPFGVLVVQPDGGVAYANPGGRQLVALCPGKHDPQGDEPVREAIGQALRGEAVQGRAFSLAMPDGPRHLEATGGPVFGPDGAVMFGVVAFQDVGERLLSEEAARRSQRLEAMGQLTGGVAHEFNNLLMAISGCLELLGERLADRRSEALIDTAARAVRRGADLTRQLLAFARKQDLRATPIDLNALVIAIEPLLASTLGRTIEVASSLDPQVWPAMADPSQLELVLLNLAINARDAMPQGGRLVIGTGNTVLGQARRHEDPAAGEYAVLRVTDEGTGMTPEIQARAFEPFFTTKEIGHGTGLGLPQVLGVAQELGGGVRIDSREGHGTTVSLYLPRAPRLIAAEAPARPAPVAVRLAGMRVLVVDDDPQVLEVTRAMLEQMAAVVCPASDGEAGLRIVRGGLRFDVALVDRAMAGLSGVDFAREVSAIDPRMAVGLMSGNPGAADPPDPSLRFVRFVLQKPFRADELAACLLAAAGRRPGAASEDLMTVGQA